MQSLIKTLTVTAIALGLTACGGSNGGSKSSTSSSSSSVSSSSLSSMSLSSSSLSSLSSSSISSSSSSLASSSVAPTESTLSASSEAGFSVAEIKDCGLNISEPSSDDYYLIIGDYDTGTQNHTILDINGWNHTANGSMIEWTNLSNAASTYNFSSTTAANADCNNVDTLNMVLVKKIADWDHQHANGIEKAISTAGKKFGDVENLIVDLKINSDKTLIPTVTSLKDIYVPTYVNETTINNLESGKVNIGITLYDGFGTTVLSGTRIIELDQTALADKWIRVTIPIAELKFCSTTNYNCTTKTLANLSDTVIDGIRFVAETKSGLVLRNSISTWSSTTPETFKEVDLSIKKVEFQLK
ncbi:MAG: hypothetical protein EOO52_12530 [Gammaproteobacteria bacterium]|nr:MAG: hypothetical protein EOO52_12530 [Gammaproteobacteria bacterium]